MGHTACFPAVIFEYAITLLFMWSRECKEQVRAVYLFSRSPVSPSPSHVTGKSPCTALKDSCSWLREALSFLSCYSFLILSASDQCLGAPCILFFPPNSTLATRGHSPIQELNSLYSSGTYQLAWALAIVLEQKTSPAPLLCQR